MNRSPADGTGLLNGKYRIEEALGKGGQGCVYKAFDASISRPVALKQFGPATNGQKEAALGANLRHPALPLVFEYFEDKGSCYAVMEFIDGEDLLSVVNRGPLEPDDVIRIADAVLEVLDYLHDQRVLHRDIKPQNLKRDGKGKIWLLDLGLAKGRPRDGSMVSAAPSLLGGTRPYSSPEQLDGNPTTRRSDLYSLGATLYHLSTGEAPPGADARRHGITESGADPLQAPYALNPRLPQGLSELIRIAMSLEPIKRPLDSREMLQRLRSFEPDRETWSPPTRNSWSWGANESRSTRADDRPFVLVMLGTKGGVGKSVFVSLASQLLAAGGYDVAVIDLDLAASGTTLRAETEFGRTKPDSAMTAFDHVARHATDIRAYHAGVSEDLWNITPDFLRKIGGGQIWLLPARDLSNTGQSFEVVANVGPNNERDRILADAVGEQFRRVRWQCPGARTILVDCGAERNPLYAAAFSLADSGFIIMSPEPEYFGEPAAIRREISEKYQRIALNRFRVVLNNASTTADQQRVRVGIQPLPLAGAIENDPKLRQTKEMGRPVHLDLGFRGIAEGLRDTLEGTLADRVDLLPSTEQLRGLSVVSHLMSDGGLDKLKTAQEGRARWAGRLVVAAAIGLGLVAAALGALVFALATAHPWTADEATRNLATLAVTGSGCVLAVLFALARRATSSERSCISLIAQLEAGASGTLRDRCSAAAKTLQSLGQSNPAIAKRVNQWIKERQNAERITRR